MARSPSSARHFGTWSQLAVHPFVQAVARGELSDEVFRRWLVNDHHYNVEYQRFIAGLAGIAPTDAATEAIATAISGSRLGLSQLRELAERFVIDLDVEPEPATVVSRVQLGRAARAAVLRRTTRGRAVTST